MFSFFNIFLCPGEFDMRVKSCIASDGAGHLIQLSDEYGCVLRPKMISRFLKARAPDERATVITYAFFHAFKFPDALSVHIKCKVEICRHGCLDHCQLNGNHGEKVVENIHERKDTIIEPKKTQKPSNVNSLEATDDSVEDDVDDDQDVFYDDIIHRGDDMAAIGGIGNTLGLKQRHKDIVIPSTTKSSTAPPHSDTLDSLFMGESTEFRKSQKKEDKFPHGPRYFEAQNRLGAPAVAGPRSLNLDDIDESIFMKQIDDEIRAHEQNKANGQSKPRSKKSIRILDRTVRNADVGVSGIYDVISEADLAFSPDTKQEAVTVFQGKIADDVIYGICMPVPGFSVLFILVTSAAIISALVAGSLLYRYQLQKETLAHQKRSAPVGVNHHPIGINSIGSWMTLRLFRVRHCNQAPQ